MRQLQPITNPHETDRRRKPFTSNLASKDLIDILVHKTNDYQVYCTPTILVTPTQPSDTRVVRLSPMQLGAAWEFQAAEAPVPAVHWLLTRLESVRA